MVYLFSLTCRFCSFINECFNHNYYRFLYRKHARNCKNYCSIYSQLVIINIIFFSFLGALFAVLIDTTPSVGASIAIYGLLGCLIAFYFINWKYLDQIYGPTAKFMNIFYIFFMVLIGFISQINNPNINIYGHLGGLIVGFFFTFIILPPMEANDGACCHNKIWIIISYSLLGVLVVVGITLFYTLDKYKR